MWWHVDSRRVEASLVQSGLPDTVWALLLFRNWDCRAEMARAETESAYNSFAMLGTFALYVLCLMLLWQLDPPSGAQYVNLGVFLLMIRQSRRVAAPFARRAVIRQWADSLRFAREDVGPTQTHLFEATVEVIAKHDLRMQAAVDWEEGIRPVQLRPPHYEEGERAPLIWRQWIRRRLLSIETAGFLVALGGVLQLAGLESEGAVVIYSTAVVAGGLFLRDTYRFLSIGGIANELLLTMMKHGFGPPELRASRQLAAARMRNKPEGIRFWVRQLLQDALQPVDTSHRAEALETLRTVFATWWGGTLPPEIEQLIDELKVD